MDISKKVFGANVTKDIRQYFKALQEGNFTIEPGDSVSDAANYEIQTYLGDRTPYARMWVAVNVREELNTEEEGPSLPGGGRGFGKTYIYSINENRENSYVADEMSSIESSEGFSLEGAIGGVSYEDQLTNNSLMKPESGITSINSKSEGAVGALRRTTVNFSVHNKQDFERIYLPFFLKPGSTVFVDLGWSDKALSLYSPESIIENENPSMDNFYNKIYGEDTVGEIEKGFRTTLSGQVTKYDVNVDEKGSFNCSLEFVSSNYALLDKSVSDDNNLKFVFKNLIEELLLTYYLKTMGVPVVKDDTLEESDSISVEERKELVKQFFDTNKEVEDVGYIDPLSAKSGIFYQNITSNTDDDRLDNQEALYMSYGLFEDEFLNNFISYWVITDDDGKETEEIKSDKAFSNSFSSQNSYVRFDVSLYEMQSADYRSSDERTCFLFPNNWDDSYNTLKPFDWGPKDGKTGTFIDKQKRRIPLRDLFIAVPTISEAFAKSSNVNDALEFIFDQIYNDSGNILNIKMIPNNDAQSSITFQDINVEADKFEDGDEKILKFDLTSGKTIVLNSDLKFETPKAGLSSMIAIGNQKNISVFDEMELIKFNFLNAISGEDRKYNVQHLPVYGEIPSKQKTLKLDLDKLLNVQPIDSTFKAKSGGPSTGDVENRFTNYLADKKKLIKEKESEEDEDEEDNGDVNLDQKPLPSETNDGKQIFYSKSEKDDLLLKAKINNFIKSSENSISPVMPISLSLKVYGNNFLGIGDFFTVNFLPKHYQDRVYFQIVGIDHNIGTSMWETTYTTVMRLKSNVKYKQYGNNSKDVEDVVVKLHPTLVRKKAEEASSNNNKFTGNNILNKLTKDVAVVDQATSETKIPLVGGKKALTIKDDAPEVTVIFEKHTIDPEFEDEDIKRIKKKKGVYRDGDFSTTKISTEFPIPTSLDRGGLSYYIIMSKLLLSSEVINWDKVKDEYKNSPPKFKLTTTAARPVDKQEANSIFVIPRGQPSNQYGRYRNYENQILALFNDKQTQQSVDDLIKNTKQTLTGFIDNTGMLSGTPGAPYDSFYFLNSIIWPLIPNKENELINVVIRGHKDFKLFPSFFVPKIYLKMECYKLTERIREDYSKLKAGNNTLDNFFKKEVVSIPEGLEQREF